MKEFSGRWLGCGLTELISRTGINLGVHYGERAKKIILLDTNILIDILQGDKNLEESIYQLGVTQCAISVITKTEIIAGMRKGEFQKTKTLLNKFRTYHISLTTSKIFLELINYTKSRNCEIFIADCLIAATAIDYNLKLYTFNRKDFDFLPNIDLFNP